MTLGTRTPVAGGPGQHRRHCSTGRRGRASMRLGTLRSFQRSSRSSCRGCRAVRMASTAAWCCMRRGWLLAGAWGPCRQGPPCWLARSRGRRLCVHPGGGASARAAAGVACGSWCAVCMGCWTVGDTAMPVVARGHWFASAMKECPKLCQRLLHSLAVLSLYPGLPCNWLKILTRQQHAPAHALLSSTYACAPETSLPLADSAGSLRFSPRSRDRAF